MSEHVKNPALPDDGMCEVCDECDGGKGHAGGPLPSPHDCTHPAPPAGNADRARDEEAGR